MKFAQIKFGEFKPKEDSKALLASHSGVVPTAQATFETTTLVSTGPTSFLNLTVYPNIEAADRTLDAKAEWFKSVAR